MSSVERFELVLLLMAASIGLELLARRLRLPPAAAFILGGIGLALWPRTPDISLDPDLALVLFLPPLLQASAYFVVWRDFRANLRIILQLAVGAVAFTTVVVGVAVHWADPSLPWAACFALGAIVAPPDAVAARAVLQRAALPRRMTVVLEGESLVNDATGLVLYRFAVAAALTGTFSVGQAALSFAGLAVGGVLAGLAFGWAGSWLIGRLRDPALATVGSFLLAWGSYIGAEWLQVSGVLCTVTSGLVMGQRQHRGLSAATRISAGSVWRVAVFILESLVFILIGLSLRGVLERLNGDGPHLGGYLPVALIVTATAVVSRFVWIFPATYLPRALFTGLRARDPAPPIAVPIIVSWAGMRGVVSLAAALALPERFPGRDLILATTFLVILVTVLLQGATLAPLIRVLNLGGQTSGATGKLTEAQARARTAHVQARAIERRTGADGAPRHPRLREQYGYRASAAQRFSEADGALDDERRAHFGAVLEAVQAGREEILRLHHEGEIHDDVLHAIEQELDLEEVTARRYMGEA